MYVNNWLKRRKSTKETECWLKTIRAHTHTHTHTQIRLFYLSKIFRLSFQLTLCCCCCCCRDTLTNLFYLHYFVFCLLVSPLGRSVVLARAAVNIWPTPTARRRRPRAATPTPQQPSQHPPPEWRLNPFRQQQYSAMMLNSSSSSNSSISNNNHSKRKTCRPQHLMRCKRRIFQ